MKTQTVFIGEEDHSDDPIEVQCKTMEEVASNIRKNKPKILVQADDPRRLRMGWSDGKTWLTISINDLKESKDWEKIAPCFWSESGREAILHRLQTIASE